MPPHALEVATPCVSGGGGDTSRWQLIPQAEARLRAGGATPPPLLDCRALGAMRDTWLAQQHTSFYQVLDSLPRGCSPVQPKPTLAQPSPNPCPTLAQPLPNPCPTLA